MPLFPANEAASEFGQLEGFGLAGIADRDRNMAARELLLRPNPSYAVVSCIRAGMTNSQREYLPPESPTHSYSQRRLRQRKFPGYCYEARQKLANIRPQTWARPGALVGVTPADLGILTIWLRSNYSVKNPRIQVNHTYLGYILATGRLSPRLYP